MHGVSDLLSSVVVAAIVSGAFGVFTLFFTLWRSNKNSKDIEALKSRLKQTEDREKTQFDWLHQRRAEAAVEVYALVVDVEGELLRLLERLTHGTSTPEEKQAMFRRSETFADKFRRRYPQLSLLLSDSVVEQLQHLDDLLWKRFIAASVHGQDQTTGDRVAMFEESGAPDMRKALRILRIALRQELGTVADDARK
jgi:hypothetical protein